jgi:hypothetical protein
MDFSMHSTDQFMHFVKIRHGRFPSKLLLTRFQFSAILIHNKAYFTYGHKWKFPMYLINPSTDLVHIPRQKSSVMRT